VSVLRSVGVEAKVGVHSVQHRCAGGEGTRQKAALVRVRIHKTGNGNSQAAMCARLHGEAPHNTETHARTRMPTPARITTTANEHASVRSMCVCCDVLYIIKLQLVGA